jgi:hypothetical protein
MPLCKLFLLSFRPGVVIPEFLAALTASNITPLVQARVVRWIILPSSVSTASLLARNNHWDILLIFEAGVSALPEKCQNMVSASWTCDCGIPSRITTSFKEKNSQLINPLPGSVKPAKKASANAQSTQALELSPELLTWIQDQPSELRTHPISMLNLLAFKPGNEAKEAYKRYGAEFASRIGANHGGDAKIVGNVVGAEAKADGWDEVALAHYPSLEHFAEMIGGAEYQEVNQKERVGSLRDTFILCTVEIDGHGELLGGNAKGRARI